MSDDVPTTRPMREFRVVCRGEHTAYMVHRSAHDPGDAMAGARKAGHHPVLCLPFGLTRAEETQVIARWRDGATECAKCGYSLVGLEGDGCITCPECGVGSVPPGRGRPHCGHCGYCLSGIAVGATDLRCPECGSDDPFVRRK